MLEVVVVLDVSLALGVPEGVESVHHHPAHLLHEAVPHPPVHVAARVGRRRSRFGRRTTDGDQGLNRF